MNILKIFALTLIIFLYTQTIKAEIYVLKDNEKIVYSVIEDKNNYAFVIEVSNTYTKKLSYSLAYSNKIRTDYIDFYSIDILKNKTLVAIMYGKSKAKDSAYIIYGNKEYKYDDIDRIIVDKNANTSLIFARYLDYGYTLVNGITNNIKYTTLLDAALKNNRYAYSYIRDEEYFINIDGVESPALGEIKNIVFSDDASKLAYVINTEDSAKIVYNGVESSSYKSIEDILFSYNNELLYTAVLMDEINTNELITDITQTNFNQLITNTTTNTITNKIISELAIAPNNTIGLVDVPIFETILSNSIITNNPTNNTITKTTVFLDGRKYKDYDYIRDIYFSPDSKVLSFIAKEGDKYYLVSSGNLSEAYTDIYFLKYFPDSKRFIYVVKNTNNIVSAIKDDKVIINADFIGQVYVSDSILAYSIIKNKREYIITKGFESPSYSTINNFSFINSGTGFAFTASRGEKQYYFTFDKQSNKKQESQAYQYISSIFTDSNNNVLAIVQREDRLYMLENGNEILSGR